MVESLKKLTVSYGAFSCTLEGFEDPFPVMKQVVDYFQALADRDPGFGAHPERPDADYLRDLAQKSVGSQDIEAEVHEGGVILRRSGDAAETFAGMEVVEETVVITPSAFQPKADDANTEIKETEETQEFAEMEFESQPQDMAALEDVAQTPAEPEITELSDFDAPEIAEAVDVAGLIDADPLPDAAQDDSLELDELAALRADIEQFDTEPVVDTSPVAAELPDILKSDLDAEHNAASTVEDFPGFPGEDFTDIEQEVAELAPDTLDAANDDTEDQPEATAETPEEPDEIPALESKTPGWAEVLLRPWARNGANDGIDVVDLGTDAIEAEAADIEISEINGAHSPDDLNPEDAALERLLKVTKSRRTEPESMSGSDALSEIREGILGMTPDTPPAQTDDEIAFSLASEEEAPAEVAETAEVIDVPETDIDLPDMHDENIADEKMHREISAEDVAVEMPADEMDASTDDKPALEDAPVFDALADADPVEADAPSLVLDKPVNVLPPLQLTPAFQIAQEVAEEITKEEMTADAPEENTAAPDTDTLVLPDESETPEAETQDQSAFRLVHNREEEIEQPEMADIPQDTDDALSLAIFASKVGAASLPELLEASAAYTTIVTGQTRFSRRSIMGMVDEMGSERKYSQEARIKSFGKLIRSGTILRVEDGQFAISRSAKFNYELKIGA